MPDNRENNPESRADELFKILDEFHSDVPGGEEAGSEKSLNEHTDEILNIISPRKQPEDGRSAASYADPDVKVYNGGHARSAAPAEEAEPSGREQDDSEIPVSLFNHLSDEGSSASAEETVISNPHFTESFTPVEPPSDDLYRAGQDADEDGDEDAGGAEDEPSALSRAGRVFQKLSLIPKAVIYIVIVALVSAYLSYYIISIGNDVFALVSDEGVVEINIPEKATDEDVAQILQDKGIIEYAWVYKLYMRYRGSGDDDSEYIPGAHRVNKNYNYSQIITALTVSRTAREVVRLTIPEGFTVDQIIDLFVENGLGTREKYIEAVNEYPYKHEFVRKLEELGYPETRKYRLEGYLFPDTYEFYTTTSEVYVINALLNNFEEKFWKDFVKPDSSGESYQQLMETQYGMTFDDIITLASMVQAEGRTAVDFECISYVFHNRLKHSGTFPNLESDATIQYTLEKREQDSKKIDVSIDTPYNTYLYPGLPPGAICNPGIETIMSAMFPSAPLTDRGYEIDAYFFVSNNAGKTYYATTVAGHENNKAQVERDNEAIEAGNYEG